MIVQNDFSIFLETSDPEYLAKRDFLYLFASLEKSPEHIHMYQITDISLWNAASLGISLDFIVSGLKKYSKYPVSERILHYIADHYALFGAIVLRDSPIPEDNRYFIFIAEHYREYMMKQKNIIPYIVEKTEEGFFIEKYHRGSLKLELLSLYPAMPVKDEASFAEGESIPSIEFVGELRPYQSEAVDMYLAGGGQGVIVLPCGSGKTIVGIAILTQLKMHTIIAVPHYASLRQWQKEILKHTNLTPDSIGEYSGKLKDIKPITLVTYQILVHSTKNKEYPHLETLSQYPWGLMLYDEVQVLPSPVFKLSAEMQSVRRLGLTATLIREDGLEKDVFTLIGPKKYDLPWKELEEKGYIAKSICYDYRVPLYSFHKDEYYMASPRKKIRIAAENPQKEDVLAEIFMKHPKEPTLIIGQYISQLESVAKRFGFILITGKTPVIEREKYYELFRQQQIQVLVLSKIGNLALDLPQARVLVQISGTYGSRQEEAQRMGRILRPKEGGVFFYTLSTQDTIDEDFAQKRQLFLLEQGYEYYLQEWVSDESLSMDKWKEKKL